MNDGGSDNTWMARLESELSKVDDLLDSAKPTIALDTLKDLTNQGYEGYFLNIAYAQVLIVLNRWQEANEHLQKAFLVNPEWYWALVLKAVWANLNGETQVESELIRKSESDIEEKPWVFLSSLCWQFEKNECKAELRAAVHLLISNFIPTSEDLLFWLLYAIKAELYQEAMPLAQRLLKESPDEWTSFIGPAFINAKLGYFEKAGELLATAESFPDFQSDDFIEELRNLLKK